MTAPEHTDDGYDPFEDFNRSAGIGLVENPYPIFALVRAEHPIKREEFDDVDVPRRRRATCSSSTAATSARCSPRSDSTRCSRC